MRNATTTKPSVRLGVLLTALVAVFLLIGGAAGAEGPAPEPEPYTVEAGDTLWAIASEHMPSGGDVRQAVVSIKELSGITSSVIYPGQILLVPTG